MAESSTTESKDVRLLAKWEKVAARYDELGRQLEDPSVHSQPALIKKLTKERSEIADVAQLLSAYHDLVKQLADAEQMLADPGVDPDLQSLATEEARRLQERRLELERQVTELLVPKDPRDEKGTFVEIRAGAGGDEAALFAGELFRMYVKYAEKKRLR